LGGKDKELCMVDSDINSEESIKKVSIPKAEYKRYNVSSEDEEKLIEKAVKLSLEPNYYENSDVYAFQ
jgi:hypothetical protein